MKVIIIEDNPSATNVLKTYLAEYSERVDIVGEGQTVREAESLLKDLDADLAFLDIHLGDEEIFSIFERWKPPSSLQTVFITAYFESEYVLQALQSSALDYLVKPLEKDKLFATLEKAEEQLEQLKMEKRLQSLEHSLKQFQSENGQLDKIPFTSMNGTISFVPSEEWIRIFTEDTITRVAFTEERVQATPKSLKAMEELLCSWRPFYRVSKQAIINLHQLVKVAPKERMAIMEDGSAEKISRRRIAGLLEKIGV
jgi:DNA-binding LytR/AlgR family response regulator